MGVERSCQKSNDIKYVAWKLKKTIIISQKFPPACVHGKKIKSLEWLNASVYLIPHTIENAYLTTSVKVHTTL